MSANRLVGTETQEFVPRRLNRNFAQYVERNTHRLRQFFQVCRVDTVKCPNCPFSDDDRASFFADPNSPPFINLAANGTLAADTDASAVSISSASPIDSPDAVLSGNVAGVDPGSQTCSKALPDPDLFSSDDRQVSLLPTHLDSAVRTRARQCKQNLELLLAGDFGEAEMARGIMCAELLIMDIPAADAQESYRIELETACAALRGKIQDIRPAGSLSSVLFVNQALKDSIFKKHKLGKWAE